MTQRVGEAEHQHELRRGSTNIHVGCRMRRSATGTMGHAHHEYTVGWVCALPLEMAAAKAMLSSTHDSLPQPPTDPNSYTLGRLGDHDIVIACLPSGVYGTTAATAVLAKMHSTFPCLRFVLMVGIGGGVPTTGTDVRLGDVVVSLPSSASSGVVQYDYGKALPNGGFERTLVLNKPPSILLNAISQLRSNCMLDMTDVKGAISNSLGKNERLQQRFKRPEKDWLFNTDYLHPATDPDCSACDKSQLLARAPRSSREPQIHYGLIASGNKLIKDAKMRDSIARELNVLCFEMEAAGLMDQLPCLVIRGICDYCDSHKNSEWQEYAAISAAAYTRLLLTVVPPQQTLTVQPEVNLPDSDALRGRQMGVLKRLNVSRYRDQKDRNSDRIPGTCEWFVGHPVFQDWRESKTSQLLWVSANPGCGKSVLAKYLCDSILASHRSRTTAYFFFKDDFEDQKSVVNALCSILHQIFHQNRDLLNERIIERFEMNERTTSSFSDLWDILTDISKEQHAGEIICILDALDECNQDEFAQLAKALQKLYRDEGRNRFNLKVLVTSRMYGRIRRGFQPLEIPGQPVIHLSGENDAEMEKICQEIDLFIRARVEAVKAQLQLTEEEREVLLQKLTSIPNRTYLWVYLTLDLIEASTDISKRGIIEATSTLPQTVDEAYEKILSRSKDRQLARRMLHIILAAARPLTLQELSFALILKEDQTSYADLELGSEARCRENIRDLCGLFVTIVDTRVYFLHQTAKEFLVQQDISDSLLHTLYRSTKEAFTQETPKAKPTNSNLEFQWRHSFGMKMAHRILALICLQHLSFANLTNAKLDAKGVMELTNRYVFLDYTARYWTAHLLESDVEPEGKMQTLLQICDSDTTRCRTWLRVYWASTGASFPTGMTTLMVASYFGLTPLVIHLVGRDDIELDETDDTYGRSALSWAAGNGHAGVVKLLVKRQWKRPFRKGSQIDAVDKQKRTPLAWASLNGHIQAVRLLLKAGAAVDSTDDIGGTPLYYAILSGHSKVTELMEQGIQVHSRDDIGRELLISAAKKGNEPMIKLLIEQGAEVDARESPSGLTPLSWAARNGHAGAVRVLIEHDANIEAKDSWRNRTPLSWATEGGCEAAVEVLLAKGADMGSRDSIRGQTPFDLAAQNNHPIIVALLLENFGLEEKVHSENLRNIVGVLVLLRKPLSVEALSRMLLMSPQDIIDQLRALDVIRTIARVPTDPGALIRFLHSSLGYFFLNTASSLRVNQSQTHTRLAAKCLRVMGLALKRNICGLPSYTREHKDISRETVHRHLREDVQYSCQYWAYHIHQSGELDTNKVLAFITGHFLHWLEAMSIMKLELECFSVLKTLMQMLEGTPQATILHRQWSIWELWRSDMKLSAFLRDAQHFILGNLPTMSTCPLQIYHSALAFAPRDSVVRQSFRNEALSIMTELPLTRLSWSTRLLRIPVPSGPVRAIEFSPDGQILASVSIDDILQLWNIKNGEEVHTIKCHFGLTWAMHFVKNREIVAASAPPDGAIVLWYGETGKEFQTLQGHSDSVSAIKFSLDGHFLASGSRDRTVRLWNLKTGEQLLTLEGHSGLVLSIALSPDGQMVASSSTDNTVRIWDCKTGQELQILQSAMASFTAVAFSPDSQLLATGSIDGTVRIWATKTGSGTRTLCGHSDLVRTLAFSSDGQILASGSFDFTIRLWDLKTGDITQTFQDHQGSVNAVAFAAENQIIASGSTDRSLRLWDTGGHGDASDPHADPLWTIVFSSHGRRVASYTEKGKIQVWDTKTGKIIQVIQSYPRDAIRTVFWYDDRLLVIGLPDHTSCYFDTTTGVPQPAPSSHGLNTKDPTPRIYLEENWVTIGGEKVLWLSHEYRQPQCFATKNNALALGYRDGQVCIINFRDSHLAE